MGGALPPFTTDALTAYADGFQTQMVKAAAGVTSYGQTTYASNALFSAACFKGQTLRSAGLWGVLVSESAEVPQPPGLGAVAVLADGAPLRSLRDVLAAWFFGGVGGLTVADTCAGGAAMPLSVRLRLQRVLAHAELVLVRCCRAPQRVAAVVLTSFAALQPRCPRRRATQSLGTLLRADAYAQGCGIQVLHFAARQVVKRPPKDVARRASRRAPSRARARTASARRPTLCDISLLPQPAG